MYCEGGMYHAKYYKYFEGDRKKQKGPDYGRVRNSFGGTRGYIKSWQYNENMSKMRKTLRITNKQLYGRYFHILFRLYLYNFKYSGFLMFIERFIYGKRKSAFLELSEEEIKLLKQEIESIGADQSIFIFNDTRFLGTGYSDKFDKIIVKGNVLPDLKSESNHPRDIMTSRAVLAHEYYGHRSFRGTKLPTDDWFDEYRASRTAAEITPNLTDEERRHLVMDALERKREAGIKVELDEFERKILYENLLPEN